MNAKMLTLIYALATTGAAQPTNLVHNGNFEIPILTKWKVKGSPYVARRASALTDGVNLSPAYELGTWSNATLYQSGIPLEKSLPYEFGADAWLSNVLVGGVEASVVCGTTRVAIGGSRASGRARWAARFVVPKTGIYTLELGASRGRGQIDALIDNVGIWRLDGPVFHWSSHDRKIGLNTWTVTGSPNVFWQTYVSTRLIRPIRLGGFGGELLIDLSQGFLLFNGNCDSSGKSSGTGMVPPIVKGLPLYFQPVMFGPNELGLAHMVSFL